MARASGVAATAAATMLVFVVATALCGALATATPTALERTLRGHQIVPNPNGAGARALQELHPGIDIDAIDMSAENPMWSSSLSLLAISDDILAQADNCSLQDGSIQPCKRGQQCVAQDSTYAAVFADDGKCGPCLLGQWCPKGSLNPAFLVTVNVCANGSYCEAPDKRQRFCPIGYFCPGGTFNYSFFPCEFEGTYCDEGSIKPTSPCPAGTYCPTPSESIVCPKGYYCSRGMTEPWPCAPLSTCPPGSKFPRASLAGVLVVVVMLIGVAVFQYTWGFVSDYRAAGESDDIRMLFRPYDLLNSLVTFALNRHIDTYEFQGFKAIDHRISLEFKDLGLVLPNGRRILNSVSGSFAAGRLVAIMGPSGCGKSTFLNTLCGKAGYGHMTGQIFVNELEGDIDLIRSVMGFVPQDDTVHANLTVIENLWYNAMLRLPASMPMEQKEAIVDDVIQILGLEAIANSVVGNVENRGISGGQRKRVNIGIELVANPSIVFLDEPTSGLDATAATEVLEALRKLSRLGMTIIMVIHQPRYSIFNLFDDVLLLGRGGHTVYLGPSHRTYDYFTGLGFKIPDHENPADSFLDIISGELGLPNEPAFRPTHLFALWKEFISQAAGGNINDRASMILRPNTPRPWDAGSMQEARAEMDSPQASRFSFPSVLPSNIRNSLGSNNTSTPKADENLNDSAVSINVGHHDDDECDTPAFSVLPATPQPGTQMAPLNGSDTTDSDSDGVRRDSLQVLEDVEGGSDVPPPLLQRGGSESNNITGSSLNDSQAGLLSPTYSQKGASERKNTPMKPPRPTTPKPTLGLPRRVTMVTKGHKRVTIAEDTPTREYDTNHQEEEEFRLEHFHELTNGDGELTADHILTILLQCGRFCEPREASELIFIIRGEPRPSSIDDLEIGETTNETVTFFDFRQFLGRHTDQAKRKPRVGRSNAAALAAALDEEDEDENGIPKRVVPGFWVQFVYLLTRAAAQTQRERRTILMDFFLLILGASVVGLVYGSNYDIIKFLTMSLLSNLTFALFMGISFTRTFGAERVNFWRENASGINSLAYFMAKNVVTLPAVVIRPLVFLALYYTFVLPRIKFIHYYGVEIGMSWASSGVGMMISTMVAPQNAIVTAVMVPMVLGGVLSGVDPSLTDLREVGINVIAWASYGRWSVEALLDKELEPYPDYLEDALYDKLAEKGFERNVYGRDVAMLFVIGLLARVFSYLGLHLLNKSKRK